MSYSSQVPPVVTAIQAAQASLPASGTINVGTTAYTNALAAFGAAQIALTAATSTATAALQPVMTGSAATPTPIGTTNVTQAVTNLLTALEAITDLATLGVMGAYVDRAMANLTNAGA